jgi:predicted dehydrogenase
VSQYWESTRTACRRDFFLPTSGCVIVDFSSREVVHYFPSKRLLAGDSPLTRAKQPGADIDQLKSEIFGEYLHVVRPEVSKADALTAELASFVDCVLNEQTPVVDGHAALTAMQAAERVLNAVAAHRWNGRGVGPIGPFLAHEPEKRSAAA